MLDTSSGRAKFARQLYNLWHILESEQIDDTETKIQQFQNRIDQHNKDHKLKSFHTKDTSGTTSGDNNTPGKKRKRSQGAGEDAGGEDGSDCAELGAHGYEVEPRDYVDEKYVIASFTEVGQLPSTCAPR